MKLMTTAGASAARIVNERVWCDYDIHSGVSVAYVHVTPLWHCAALIRHQFVAPSLFSLSFPDHTFFWFFLILSTALLHGLCEAVPLESSAA